ncbi:DUF2264 domain-containing protein [Streptomyces pinistramenti]|uniref:DUF2264 domain-containing protein n=1 Tax=Streptomyces pinistramenti TaxID=2884812 RepID=UPI001D07616E|nr:DUF2264 domain-containing protein [Streptomyces pinistramenti]MCB5906174.1 DUF2264 domain-containing protein [Streptomyces pinistramenti]
MRPPGSRRTTSGPPGRPGRLVLPPEDRIRSPRTGWTRAHWEAVADHLLDSLRPYVSPLGASVRPPGRPSWSGPRVDGLEGYARSFLLAAVRLAGADGMDPGGRTEPWVRGLIAGTERHGPESWPDIADFSQPMVEAAVIAVALHLSKPWIWDRLAHGVQERVAHWLMGTVGRRTRHNNHLLFQVVVAEFLHSVGALDDRSGIEAALDRVDEWYRGDGWYQDGPSCRSDYRDTDGTVRAPASVYDAGERFDHYNAWGFHLYTLLWTRIAGPRGDDRAAVYRDRLRAFLAQYVLLFGSDGAPVHHGRSLTYRFACLAPLWVGAWEDATPLSPGVTRRLASATLRHFVEHEVPDDHGLLTPGWYRAFRPMVQDYSGPGEPYAASKGLLGLLLPPDHPVWTAAEEALPVESGDYATALPVPGFLVHGTRRDGLVRLLNHGSHYLTPPPATHRDDPHYAKLAYSTRTGPEAGGDTRTARFDNHIALVTPTGDVSRRERIHRVVVADGHAASWHQPRTGDSTTSSAGRIDSVSVVCGPWEIRVHRVTAPAGLLLREGGYALACRERPLSRVASRRAVARRTDGLASGIVGLHGWDTAQVRHESGTNAFGEHSCVPYLTAVTGAAEGSVHVSGIVLSGAAGGPLDEVLRHDITVAVDAGTVHLRVARHGGWLIRPGTSRPVTAEDRHP